MMDGPTLVQHIDILRINNNHNANITRVLPQTQEDPKFHLCVCAATIDLKSDSIHFYKSFIAYLWLLQRQSVDAE